MERLKNLEEKISIIVEKAKRLKEEREEMNRKVDELANLLGQKDNEIETLKSEKVHITEQIESLLNDIDNLDI